MGVSSGTTCTFNADDDHASKLQGCEDVNGGQSVCCVAVSSPFPTQVGVGCGLWMMTDGADLGWDL